MSDNEIKKYLYNPHRHVKIWFSNKPAVFLNTENQMRLIAMRDKNPDDAISLVYDSSLLNQQAINDLHDFCREHTIAPIDANDFGPKLVTEKERILYKYFKDEVTHIGEGGNLALASDIIRWLNLVYTQGTYTDFDVPVDTSALPDQVAVAVPLLLNIGSLKLRNKEVVLTNNDYIAIVDPKSAQQEIEKIQAGFIKVLGNYNTDFIEETERTLGGDSFFRRLIINLMKNRSESIYIAKSRSVFNDGKQRESREVRQAINELMSDQNKFLDFNKINESEPNEAVIERLRKGLNKQLGFIKWLFFRKEYYEDKAVLAGTNDELLSYLMKKEKALYLKSIVVCTTGPIAVAKSLFDGYVFGSAYFSKVLRPYSFNHYGLQHAFQSKNSIPLHTSIWQMMNFLGAEDGSLNDSSWLEQGAIMQGSREVLLDQRRQELRTSLPTTLLAFKKDMEEQINKIEAQVNGLFGFYRKESRAAKIQIMYQILACFETAPKNFNVRAFRSIMSEMNQNKDLVYAGLFSSHTQELIEQLEKTCHEAVVFGLTNNRNISLIDGFPVKETKQTEDESGTCANVSSYGADLSFFKPELIKEPIDEGCEYSSPSCHLSSLL